MMCSYIVDKIRVTGSAKGQSGWISVDTAHVFFDHPFHATLDHALGVDFLSERDGGRERIAIELSAESARQLAHSILAALERGEVEHGQQHDGSAMTGA